MAGPGRIGGTLRGPWRRGRGLVTRLRDGLRWRHARRGGVDVFPWMEHSALAAAVLGAVVGSGLGRACDLGSYALVLGASAGALGGAWLALSWAVPAAGPRAGGVTLWDPWLDADRGQGDEEPPTPPADDPDGDAVGPSADGAGAGRARVRPRVLSPEGGEPLPLEEAIGPILAGHERGAVRVSGPDGSGKTTALNHLAALVPPHLGVTFLDGQSPRTLTEAAARGRVVFASIHPPPEVVADLRLAPWGRDDWIEYLLAGDRGRCASVMARLARLGAGDDPLEGLPELWSIVLERMAGDDAIAGPREALRAELDRRIEDPEARRKMEGECLAGLVLRGGRSSPGLEILRRHGTDEAQFRLTRHRAVQLLLAADRIAGDLARGEPCPALAGPLPRELVREAALRIGGRPGAVDRLRHLVIGPDLATQPTAASLLHALGIGWKPDRPAPCLSGAYLGEAPWAGVELSGVDLRGADLHGSDLWGARLDRALLGKARLDAADLRTASLCAARLVGADLTRARLGSARARDAHFGSARLAGADLEGANLDRATFLDADLGGARLAGASLVGADLTRAGLGAADFSRADLSGAVLRGQKLGAANFTSARFHDADLSGSDLEGIVLPRAAFLNANLDHALLTASRMPEANLRGARLRGAGLAGVEWERADLRGADLREAAFHLGSARSGLVGSRTPCEGSRTGFYTDDSGDQDYKSPEEIRKANLTWADLRGARLDGVDFYLVDLRGARFDPEYLPHLRQSGAILVSRA